MAISRTKLHLSVLPSLFGFAPGGVCHTVYVAIDAVRSYRTLSPLPAIQQANLRNPAGGLLSVALSLGLPPPGVTRHRVPVEPGLSSPAIMAKAITRSSHTNPNDAAFTSKAQVPHQSNPLFHCPTDHRPSLVEIAAETRSLCARPRYPAGQSCSQLLPVPELPAFVPADVG